jgi:hypothetical protein
MAIAQAFAFWSHLAEIDVAVAHVKPSAAPLTRLVRFEDEFDS